MSQPHHSTTPPLNVTSLQDALEEHAIDQLVTLHADGATPIARQAFTRWRQQSPAHEAAAHAAEQLWQDIGQTHQAHQQQLSKLTQPAPTRHRSLRWLTGTLAASLCVFAVSLQYIPLASYYADYSTHTSEQRQIRLPDGSVIYLNSATALSVEMQPAQRRITLHNGEALFRVTPDAARPFIVTSADSETRVLGTTFSVRQQGDTSQITVQEGKVELRDRTQPGLSQSLTANQQSSLTNHTLSPAQPVNSHQLLAWQRGRLIFNQQPLAEVVTELQRHLPGRILITDRQLAAQQVSGIFNLQQPDSLLHTLQQSLEVDLIQLPLLTLILPTGG